MFPVLKHAPVNLDGWEGVSPQATQHRHIGSIEGDACCGNRPRGHSTGQHICATQARGQDAPRNLHQEEAVKKCALRMANGSEGIGLSDCTLAYPSIAQACLASVLSCDDAHAGSKYPSHWSLFAALFAALREEGCTKLLVQPCNFQCWAGLITCTRPTMVGVHSFSKPIGMTAKVKLTLSANGHIRPRGNMSQAQSRIVRDSAFLCPAVHSELALVPLPALQTHPYSPGKSPDYKLGPAASWLGWS